MEQENQIERKSKFAIVKKWVELVRDIGVIVGIPILIGVGMNLYGKQIDALKEQNNALKTTIGIHKAEVEFYKQTQYPQALSQIESQKKLFENERKSLIDQIAILESKGEQETEQIKNLKNKLEVIDLYLNDMKELSDDTWNMLKATYLGLKMSNFSISFTQKILQNLMQDDDFKQLSKELLAAHEELIKVTYEETSKLEKKYKEMEEKLKNLK